MGFHIERIYLIREVGQQEQKMVIKPSQIRAARALLDWKQGALELLLWVYA